MAKCKNDFKKFWKRFLYRYGEMEYIAVFDPHQKGTWHIHVLVKKDSVQRLKLSKNEVEKIWGNGYIRISDFRNHNDMGLYFCNLLGENISKDKKKKSSRLEYYPLHAKIYTSSKGLAKPTLLHIDDEELKEIVGNRKPCFEQGYSIRMCDTDHEVNRIGRITYNDKAPETDRGKTDTLSSKVIFQSDALVPQYSEKTVSLALREGVADHSYTLKNDYSAQKSELTMAGKETSVLDFSGKSFVNVYDNEMLYYTVRAFSDIKAGGGNTFTLANFFDMHVKNKFSTYSMRFACGEEGSEQTVYLPFKGTYLDDQGSATVLKVSVSINESLSGPPTELYFSMTPFKTGENTSTKKVLVSFKTFEYNLSNSNLKYTTEYNITDYSVTP